MEELFTKYFLHNSWGNSESLSGGGSTQNQTKHIQEYIVLIVKKYNIKTLFDVPCGDFNWFKNIVHHIPNYIGADIVNALIERNNKLYDTQKFIHFDITTDTFPENIDLIFCRDLFVHFPLEKISTAIKNIKKSNARYLMTTTYINRQFRDIELGRWRPISFFDHPFNFPRPLENINENSTEAYPKYIDKCLALWLIKDIPDF